MANSKASVVIKPVVAFQQGATFVFGSWVCTADEAGRFSRYLEHQPEQKIATSKLQRQALEDLVENFDEISLSDYNTNWENKTESISTSFSSPIQSNESAIQPSFDSDTSPI